MRKGIISLFIGALLLTGIGCADDLNEVMFGPIVARTGHTVTYQGENFSFQFKYPLNKEFETESVEPRNEASESIRYKVGLLPAFYVNVYEGAEEVLSVDAETDHYKFMVEGAGEPEDIVTKIKETFEAFEATSESDKSTE